MMSITPEDARSKLDSYVPHNLTPPNHEEKISKEMRGINSQAQSLKSCYQDSA
jgi:hypothetical protein